MGNKHIGGTFEEFEAEMLSNRLITQAEIDASEARVAILNELIKARNEGKISQRKLEEMSGVRQPVIARMESGKSSPALDTVLRVLAPLGKTLAVVPLHNGK
ncbi:MAG: helix-turn-helix domain-containing protein [Clostridiales Family XIII bacterium]|jgi:Trp operon repressor|nr:helix-turn-helix domain-containing protein [Clostridiales Family XIII bacterium]